MFEAAEVGHKVRKAEYETLVPQLRVDLVNAQYDLRTADFPVIIVIAGNDRAGCNDALRKLHEVMDARFMQTNALGPPTEEELERPRFWRYWRRLPPRGRIGIFLGAWVASLIRERFDSTLDPAQVRQRIDHIRRFEEHLVNDGALILKFWLHLPKKRAQETPEAGPQAPRTGLAGGYRGLGNIQPLRQGAAHRRAGGARDEHRRGRPGTSWKAPTRITAICTSPAPFWIA